jgi:hypothetical protein
MRRIAVLAVLGAMVMVVPALAKKPPKPPKTSACVAHNTGYDATGTLVASSLKPAGHGRYNGMVEANVTIANHHVLTGDQTFTLSNAQVEAHGGINPATPAAGSVVKLHGKITELPKPCSTVGFTPTVTVKKVDIGPAPPACVAHNAGYDATGTLVASSLKPAGHGRYNGMVEVDVTKAIHHALTGDQKFTLSNAKIKFHHGVNPATPAAGSAVELHGKTTELPKPCSTIGFTPAVTVKKVNIGPAAPPHPSGLKH